MKIIEGSLTGTQTTEWFPVDKFQNPFNISIFIAANPTGVPAMSGKITLQFTFNKTTDDVKTADIINSITIDNSDVTSNENYYSNIVAPCTYIRFVCVNVVEGELDYRIEQAINTL